MADTIVVETASGGKLIFGAPHGAGLREVGVAGGTVKASEGEFEKAIGMIGDLVAMLDKSVGALVKRPSTVEMEFGAKLAGKTNLWVVSGEGEAEFKVKLVWEGEDKAKA